MAAKDAATFFFICWFGFRRLSPSMKAIAVRTLQCVHCNNKRGFGTASVGRTLEPNVIFQIKHLIYTHIYFKLVYI